MGNVKEAKAHAEEAVSTAKATRAKADGQRALAKEEANSAAAVSKRNAEVIGAAREAANARREADVALSAAMSKEKELDGSLSKAQAAIPKAKEQAAESVTARKSAAGASDDAKLKYDEAAAAVEAKKKEHRKLLTVVDGLKRKALDAAKQEEEVRKAQDTLTAIATQKNTAAVKATKALTDARQDAESASNALEESLAKLKDFNQQIQPARDNVDAAANNAIDDSAVLAKRQVTHENSVVLLNAAKAALTESKKAISDLKDEIEAVDQAIEDAKKKVDKQTKVVDDEKADRADALDKVDKSNLSVTEQQKEETAKSKEHSDAEDKHEAEQGQLQVAKGKHDLAQTTLTAAQKAVDDSMAEIKSI